MRKLLALAVLLAPAIASAHDAPLGWTYGWECCSGMDCRQIDDVDVEITKAGFRIKRTGEVIPYGDKRIHQSKDQFYHQCTPGGNPDAPKSICLYVPNMGF